MSTQLKNALNTVEDIYTQRITHYRRLLERVREYLPACAPSVPESNCSLDALFLFTHQAQSSSAQQLLALEAALNTEKARTADAEAEAKKLKERLDKLNKVKDAS